MKVPKDASEDSNGLFHVKHRLPAPRRTGESYRRQLLGRRRKDDDVPLGIFALARRRDAGFAGESVVHDPALERGHRFESLGFSRLPHLGSAPSRHPLEHLVPTLPISTDIHNESGSGIRGVLNDRPRDLLQGREASAVAPDQDGQLRSLDVKEDGFVCVDLGCCFALETEHVEQAVDEVFGQICLVIDQIRSRCGLVLGCLGFVCHQRFFFFFEAFLLGFASRAFGGTGFIFGSSTAFTSTIPSALSWRANKMCCCPIVHRFVMKK